MDRFAHHDGRLWCEGLPLDALAAEVGTPAYVYSRATIEGHVQAIREAFAAVDPLICYAAKANGNLAVLKVLAEAGCGFDIVSGGELARALAIGADPQRIVFSGVGKTREEMVAALDANILLFNVESEGEVDVLAEVAKSKDVRAPLSIRVNPDVDPKTHRYISTGKRESKFGVDLERGRALATRVLADPHLSLRGIQCHIGSQVSDVEPYRAAVERTTAFALSLREQAKELAWLDMGGGYGIYYRDAKVPALSEYADAVLPLVEGTGLRLVMEPGRVIVGNAGVLLTKVLYNKVGGDRRFVIVDAGMNDLIRPSLYDGYHRIWPVVGAPPPPLGSEAEAPLADIVGPVCESGDFLALDRPLPEVLPGDLLAVFSAGAYAFCMSSNYNDRPRPPEVLVEGDAYRIVRPRETHADLLRLERPDAPRLRLDGAPAHPEATETSP